MVDIQSPTAEIRQGKKKKMKKEERKKIETTEVKYNGLTISVDGISNQDKI